MGTASAEHEGPETEAAVDLGVPLPQTVPRSGQDDEDSPISTACDPCGSGTADGLGAALTRADGAAP